ASCRCSAAASGQSGSEGAVLESERILSRAVHGKAEANSGHANGTGASGAAEGTRAESEVISLKEMGVTGAIEMHGPHSYSTVHFTLPHQLVPKEGILK